MWGINLFTCCITQFKLLPEPWTKTSSLNVPFFWFSAGLLEFVLKIILLRKGLTSLVCLCCAQGFLYRYWTTQASRNSPANFRIHYTVPVFSVQCQWNIPSRLRLLLWCSTTTPLFCIEKSAQPVNVCKSVLSCFSPCWISAIAVKWGWGGNPHTIQKLLKIWKYTENLCWEKGCSGVFKKSVWKETIKAPLFDSKKKSEQLKLEMRRHKALPGSNRVCWNVHIW